MHDYFHWVEDPDDPEWMLYVGVTVDYEDETLNNQGWIAGRESKKTLAGWDRALAQMNAAAGARFN